eukprot:TRINITY_DN63161_c0_g1_i1.p1 TRINITY_DN63161_c0_g1~~TRINITY_DN63161_c0_g1_i1.p1  ORF type:complete len:365 (+),score=62.94 TRINITY_DN63161_c0_g1_i1:35-1129(+)
MGTGNITILDGSTGYALLANGLPEDEMFSKIWSASALVDEKYHELVIKTHMSYLEVGATAITTNSYATQPTYYEKAFGIDFEPLMLKHAELSAQLAVKARERFLKDNPGAEIVIQGSLPPLAESHRPDIFKQTLAAKGDRFFIECYKKLAQALLRGGSDVLLFETLNCWEEARLGLEAMVELKEQEVPIIVSFEGSLRADDLTPQPHLAPSLCEKVMAYKADQGLPIKAIGWNCAPPEDILDNLEALQTSGMLKKLCEQGLEMVVYGNLHERKVYDEGFDVNSIDASEHAKSNVECQDVPEVRKSPIRKRKDMTEGSTPFAGYVSFVHQCVHTYGVSSVGGCCGCGPAGIEAVCRDIKSFNVSK